MDARLGLQRIGDTFEFNFKIYELGCDEMLSTIKKTWESDVFVKGEKNLGVNYLLMLAGDDRMLALYKRACRTFWQTYPESIAFYIMEYRKEYDLESLIGTKYEYLLHEYDDKLSE